LIAAALLVAFAFYVSSRYGEDGSSGAATGTQEEGAPSLSPENEPPSHGALVLEEVAVRKATAVHREGEKPGAPPSAPNPARPNQAILTFKNAGDLQAFLGGLPGSGVRLLGRIDSLHSIALGYDDPALLKSLLPQGPSAPTVSGNFLLNLPDPAAPPAPSPELTGNYALFEDQTLTWLGVDTDNSTWGKGITVAVIDSGITSHPTFAQGSIEHVPLNSSTHMPATANPEATLTDGHGTAVAAIIAGTAPEARGVAPSSRLLDYNVFQGQGSADAFTVAQAIVDAVDRGAHLINLSLGGPGDDPTLQAAIDYAAKRNVLVVAAAGNEGTESISFPARYPSVVAVSAVDALGQSPSFNNHGVEMDLAAPGLGIHTAWSGGNLVEFSGTSAAAPVITASLAALMSQNRGMTASQAFDVLKSYSNEAGPPKADPVFGVGIVDIGRAMNRNQPGIVDAAIASHFLDLTQATDSMVPVQVTVQNQGTTPIAGSKVAVKVNGVESSFFPPHLPPGAISVHTVKVPRALLEKPDGVSIESTITTRKPDVFSNNNSRASKLRKSTPK
jgi:hypothetical protein